MMRLATQLEQATLAMKPENVLTLLFTSPATARTEAVAQQSAIQLESYTSRKRTEADRQIDAVLDFSS